jgi:hypothetical protein
MNQFSNVKYVYISLIYTQFKLIYFLIFGSSIENYSLLYFFNIKFAH